MADSKYILEVKDLCQSFSSGRGKKKAEKPKKETQEGGHAQ